MRLSCDNESRGRESRPVVRSASTTVKRLFTAGYDGNREYARVACIRILGVTSRACATVAGDRVRVWSLEAVISLSLSPPLSLLSLSSARKRALR